jgi:hypothetical protein
VTDEKFLLSFPTSCRDGRTGSAVLLTATVWIFGLEQGHALEDRAAGGTVASPANERNPNPVRPRVEHAADDPVALPLEHQHCVEGWKDAEIDGVNHSGLRDQGCPLVVRLAK